ncbi:MAG: LytTR family transcriptional regulator [Bacteroidales bacterium]|nr:LytTR family transcriptional regulator [Bacteroidales bacterium]
MNLIKYINQPFPKAENKWKIIIIISLFVSLFLIIFQPFGIHLMESKNKYLILSGFGLVTFIALFINLIIIENIFQKYFNEKNWIIWKEFTWLLWVIFSIGLGNAFYTNYLIDGYFQYNFHFLVLFQLYTMIIGTIPITILIITKQKYLLTRHLISANDLNKSLDQIKTGISKNQLIRFYADNDKDFIEFNNDDFYFIESSGNYVEIYLLDEDKITRKTFRRTLKRALDFFNNIPEITQCHRAFVVNTNKIASAKGNSQGLRLSLTNCDTEIPVSRGFVNSVREKINHS